MSGAFPCPVELMWLFFALVGLGAGYAYYLAFLVRKSDVLDSLAHDEMQNHASHAIPLLLSLCNDHCFGVISPNDTTRGAVPMVERKFRSTLAAQIRPRSNYFCPRLKKKTALTGLGRKLHLS